ncbi:MAG: methyltransferase domain-containing protein [Myxococcota bacterium]
MTVTPTEEELRLMRVTLAGRPVELWCVRDLDVFLDRLIAVQGTVGDDDIPYYAHLWPTARVLAEELLKGPSLEGVAALELGCGLGLVGLCAALQGAHVLMTDLQPGALDLVMKNAARNGVQARITTQLLDWRHPPEGLQRPLVLASDVLYEARFAVPLAETLRRVLQPGGIALLGDPSRPHLDRFLEAAHDVGLAVRPGPFHAPTDSSEVRLYAVQHRGDARVNAPWER